MVRMEQENERLTVYLRGELDHDAARRIREEVDGVIRRGFPKQLILDFSGVGFMDSSGIGLILGRYKLMRSVGGELILRALSPAVERMIELSGLCGLVTIEQK